MDLREAKQFLNGEQWSSVQQATVEDTPIDSNVEMTKEIFDTVISAFIQKKGNIYKVDFGREYNKLPSFRYVRQYYGDLSSLKKAFGDDDPGHQRLYRPGAHRLWHKGFHSKYRALPIR